MFDRTGVDNRLVLNLLVITPIFLGILCGCLLVLVLLSVRRWRQRRWITASLMTVFTVLLGASTAADFVNAHYQYVPQVRDVADLAFPGVAYPRIDPGATDGRPGHPHEAGGVIRVRLPNGNDGLRSSHALVYLPAD
jgi:hypothetical protein